MIVIMTGLPGTGKSTLARELAKRLNGLVVDKDTVRAAMFGPFVDYTHEQDNLAMESVFAAARYAAQKGRTAFIDGRPFGRKWQFERAMQIAQDFEWRVIETVCSDDSARKRLALGGHLAANRNYDLYLSRKAEWEPIPEPKLVIDTDRGFEECVAACLSYTGH